MNIRISPRRAGWFLGCAIAFLALAALAVQVARYTINDGAYKWYTALFDLDREQNIPSWWQGTTILMCAVLLTLIAVYKRRIRDRFRWSWAGLAAIFFLLAIDEICSLHEQMSELFTSRGIQLHGAFEYQWVIPGMAFVLVIGLTYLRFLLNLPRQYGVRFALAGAIYISGVIGVEMLSGWYATQFGDNNLTFQAIATFEEITEMAGIALFLVSLVSYAGQIIPQVTIEFDTTGFRASTQTGPQLATERAPRGRVAA